MISKKTIVWFEEVGKEDVGLVGGKGANLGEMTNAKLPIPYGFVVTSNAYFDFIEKSKLKDRIVSLLKNLNYENSEELHQAARHIREMILKAPMPAYLIKDIIKYYENLVLKEKHYYNLDNNLLKTGLNKVKSLYDPPLVAVRSSATAEDLPGASFAGQQETYLNVRGEAHLITKIRECYASLFTDRAIYYRFQQKFDHSKVGLAAVVQRMVQSDKSGIAFSIDPVTNDKNKIVIEAIVGLGEFIVQGKVTPDHYEVSKNSFVIIKKEVKKQDVKMVRSNISNKEVKLGAEGRLQKISDDEVLKVAILVADIEKHYYFPQDIEWAIEKDRVYIVQSIPVTTIKKANDAQDNRKASSVPIIVGSPASPGIGVGQAKIIFSPKEISKIKSGDILVAPQTNPDYVPAMKKSAAIVTEKGGRTSHAAIVSRELGIPAVVGAEGATKIIRRRNHQRQWSYRRSLSRKNL